MLFRSAGKQSAKTPSLAPSSTGDANISVSASDSKSSATTNSNPKPATKPRKLSYKEQRELEGLPERITALETEQKQVQAELADPKLYASDAAKAVQLHERDQAIEAELMQALERWELLST